MPPFAVGHTMPRLRAVSLASVILLGLAAPVLAAQPVPFVDAEYVTAWRAFLLDDGRSCSAYDPAVRLLELPTLTALAHAARDEVTEYTLAIRPAAGQACPDVTLSFSSAVAWPQGEGTVSAACGLLGDLQLEDQGDNVRVWLQVNVPAACEAGYAGSLVFEGIVVRPHPAPGRYCVPMTPVGYLCRNVPGGALP